MTTYDAFQFGWELDILEIRLRTLEDVVDVHVIAESPLTHRGVPKPLHLIRWPDRLKRWEHKVRYVTPHLEPGAWGCAPRADFSAADNADWAREIAQRDALMAGLTDAADDDLVHISDCDEIPDPVCFADAAQRMERWHCEAVQYPMPMHVGWLDRRWAEPHIPVSRFLRGSTVKRLGVDGSRRLPLQRVGIVGRGWHLSYVGGVEAVQAKLAAVAHSELDRAPFNTCEWIEARLADGADIFGRPDRPCLPVQLSELPPCVRDDPGAWRHLLADWAP